MFDTLEETNIIKIDTGVEGAEPGDTVNVTQKALEMILKVREDNSLGEDYALRLGTRNGGCSGISYAIGFDNERYDNDRLFQVEGLSVVIDARSVFYFMGVTLDYIDGPEGSGFIFSNPNNFHTCGCSG